MTTPDTIAAAASGSGLLVLTVIGVPVWLLVLGAACAVAGWGFGIWQTRRRAEVAQVALDAEARADAEAASLRRAYAEHPQPHVYVDPAAPIDGARFEWVNAAAVERWGRSFAELTTRPYSSFLSDETLAETEREARRADATGADISGIVNVYPHGVTGHPVYNRWRRIGATGYWVAEPYDGEAAQRQRAEAANEELDAIRDELFGNIRPQPAAVDGAPARPHHRARTTQ